MKSQTNVMNEEISEVEALVKAPPRTITHVVSKRSFAKLGCTFSFLACIVYLFGVANRTKEYAAQNQRSVDLYQPQKDTIYPRFIFGHSTGHSGTGTFHQSILLPGCPWNSTLDEFEYLADGERKWPYDADCSLVERELIPHLWNATSSVDGPTVYVDIGHFHNRGRTLECLAKHLKDRAVFVHIRRNRYSIARSFADSMSRLTSKYPEMKITPCISRNVIEGQDLGHPHVSICPRSTENAGPVDLPISNDSIWDSFSTFQQFLWYADEMEHRWHTLKKIFIDEIAAPTFIEVSWDNEEELQIGVNQVREQLGCSTAEKLVNQHPHVEHKSGTLNCSHFIWEDLQYRKTMKFDSDTEDILFARAPQNLDGGECIEGISVLRQKITEYAAYHGVEFIEAQWKLPHEKANH